MIIFDVNQNREYLLHHHHHRHHRMTKEINNRERERDEGYILDLFRPLSYLHHHSLHEFYVEYFHYQMYVIELEISK
jgi:hypothetical protein